MRATGPLATQVLKRNGCPPSRRLTCQRRSRQGRTGPTPPCLALASTQRPVASPHRPTNPHPPSRGNWLWTRIASRGLWLAQSARIHDSTNGQGHHLPSRGHRSPPPARPRPKLATRRTTTTRTAESWRLAVDAERESWTLAREISLDARLGERAGASPAESWTSVAAAGVSTTRSHDSRNHRRPSRRVVAIGRGRGTRVVDIGSWKQPTSTTRRTEGGVRGGVLPGRGWWGWGRSGGSAGSWRGKGF
jgi:hypothetical protein